MKGIYVLLVSIAQNISVRVGGLGDKSFQEGLYAYVGSAQNNLEKRVERHLRRVKSRFWHIDYLLNNREAKVHKVFFKEAGRPEECRVAERLAEIASPIMGFGSSDCPCKGHLFRVEANEHLSKFMGEIGLKPLRKMVLMAKTGWCVWVTGLPGSGKSTVSEALLELLKKEGVHAQLLSSDTLRRFLPPSRPIRSKNETRSMQPSST